MGKSKIIWTEQNWEVTGGCTKCSEGCRNCYAIPLIHRFACNTPMHGDRYKGLVDNGNWTGQIKLFKDRINQPLNRKKPTTYFVNSRSDLFHKGVPFPFIYEIFAMMRQCKQHTFQILTKRPERVRLIPKVQWMNNIHFGVSICTQEEADEKIPILLRLPAAKRFVSLEPLLGRIKLTHIKSPERTLNALRGKSKYVIDGNTPYYGHSIDQIIIGCEKLPGKKAGRFQDGFIAAAIDIVNQCKAAGVKVFVKQVPINGKVVTDMNKFPKELQFQEKL